MRVKQKNRGHGKPPNGLRGRHPNDPPRRTGRQRIDNCDRTALIRLRRTKAQRRQESPDPFVSFASWRLCVKSVVLDPWPSSVVSRNSLPPCPPRRIVGPPGRIRVYLRPMSVGNPNPAQRDALQDSLPPCPPRRIVGTSTSALGSQTDSDFVIRPPQADFVIGYFVIRHCV